MSKKVGLICIALLLLVALAAYAQQPFADVKPDHWAYAAVTKLQQDGIVAGYPDGYFRGNRTLTRYEFAQALFRALQTIDKRFAAIEEEHAALGKRLDNLESRVAALEAKPGGAGLTAEQSALLERLEKEFAPELKSVRADYEALAKRVAALEAREPVIPKFTVNGSVAMRGGFYGTKIATGTPRTTGYPFAVGETQKLPDGSVPYGAINFRTPIALAMYETAPGDALISIPISDATKDAFKANDFMHMQAFLTVNANVSDRADARVSLRADARGNNAFPSNEVADSANVDGISGANFNNTLDNVRVDEAWVRVKTRLIAPDVTLVAGKQYFGVGQGLLANNEQFPMKSVRADFAVGKTIDVGGVVGMLDREALGGLSTGSLAGVTGVYVADKTSGQDNYNLFWLKLALGRRLDLGFNWLNNGVGSEAGWSVDVTSKLVGLDIGAEYAKLTKDVTGMKPNGQDAAWVVGIGQTHRRLMWSAKYGELEARYAFAMGATDGTPFVEPNVLISRLYPDAAFNPFDINWVDRPLFLDPTNVVRGWEGKLRVLLGEKTPIEFRYYGGDAFKETYLGWLLLQDAGVPAADLGPRPSKFRRADAVWTIKVSHELAKDVTASLLYGQRNADHVLSPTPGFLHDSIKVVRGEVQVAF